MCEGYNPLCGGEVAGGPSHPLYWGRIAGSAEDPGVSAYEGAMMLAFQRYLPYGLRSAWRTLRTPARHVSLRLLSLTRYP